MGSPIKLKQKLSPKASAAKKARDIAAAMTPKRRARKAERKSRSQGSPTKRRDAQRGCER